MILAGGFAHDWNPSDAELALAWQETAHHLGRLAPVLDPAGETKWVIGDDGRLIFAFDDHPTSTFSLDRSQGCALRYVELRDDEIELVMCVDGEEVARTLVTPPPGPH